MKKISDLLFLLALAALACSSTDSPVYKTPAPQITAQPTPLPTPFSRGDQVVWRDLQVIMDQVEVTGDFVNEYGSTRLPADGKKFMWVHVQVGNIGKEGNNVPLPENFSVLYAAAEFKPVYGHRQGYAEFASLNPVIFPGQTLDGWLRFDIPITAEIDDMLFVFLPESSQVGASPDSPNYPYAGDKPTYVWECKP